MSTFCINCGATLGGQAAFCPNCGTNLKDAATGTADVKKFKPTGEKADAQLLNALTLPLGLAFCGDAFVGGRVHLALENGVAVARQLISVLLQESA